MSDRIAYAPFKDLVVSADEAAKFVNNGDRVGISGFTGAGYPKALPTAIAEKAKAAHAAGEEFKIDLFSGASTAPDCDGVLAEADALRFRSPYNSIRFCVTRQTPVRFFTRTSTCPTLASRLKRASTVTSRSQSSRLSASWKTATSSRLLQWAITWNTSRLQTRLFSR